ncbi:MAG: FAD-dependent oxidoreductase, partial [Gammaproteobacteria bacterium]
MRAVVIGAGLLGISSALFLRRAGVEVVVVDRADGPGRETSFANGGLLTPSMADPWNAPGILRKMLRWIGHEDAPVLLRPRALASLGVWGIDFLRQSTPERFRRNLLRNVRLANYTLNVMADLRSEYDLDYDGASSGSLKLLR